MGVLRTLQGDRDVPPPGPDPWSEIRPHLWMGGHYWTDAHGELRPAVVTGQFDLVVSLYVLAGHGPDAGVEHRVLEIPDRPLASGQIEEVARLAEYVAEAVRAKRTTLVRCHAGLNRSGLVSAQALVHLGMEVGDAVELLRRRRSPFALHNGTFEAYLRTGLAVAALLSGLS
ncbi:dual specificity protein phosphatase family protein [Kibdelosporangium lantanae]